MERRKNERIPIDVRIFVDRIYKQDKEIIENLQMDIDITDISKSGIGFLSNVEVPVGYYFDGTVKLGGTDFFRAVFKIVRYAKEADMNRYGAEFVGLAPFLANKVDDYSKTIGNVQE